MVVDKSSEGERNMAKAGCDTCVYYEYDEEYEDYGCTISFDEDEMAHMMQDSHYECPYYKFGDEYVIVRKQM